MLDRLKASLAEDHSAQYEAVQEEGLRMVVFGKPGSGKVGPPCFRYDPECRRADRSCYRVL
jgi:hypothetical protein